MGLLNVIKLANDYSKAKKALKEKKVNIDKVKGYIDSLKKIVEFYKEWRIDIEERISKVKELINGLKQLETEGED